MSTIHHIRNITIVCHTCGAKIVTADTSHGAIPLTAELRELLRAAIAWTDCTQMDMLQLSDDLEQYAEEWARSPQGLEFAKGMKL